MSGLFTFNNDIMEVIVSKLDTESHLIVALTCKELYKILKTFNENKKLSGSLKYLTSNLNLLKYGHLNKCPWTKMTIDKIFTSNERPECFKYAIDNDCPLPPHICNIAARHGYLECLKYLHENGCPWKSQTCAIAAINGHLECLKYLHENGCPWTQFTCSAAAEGGHLECLKYAHENGCPWSSLTCESTASGAIRTHAVNMGNGHLECLKYAHENGCPWQEWICTYAVKAGHLEMLKYAHENGCPWSSHTFYCASIGGPLQLECLQYLRDNGCAE
jgi:hypothetical protein